MPRTTKKVTSACDHHQFTLKPLGDYIIHGQHLNVSFCLNNQQKNIKKGFNDKIKDCLGCPVFNTDGNDATPTFILSSQKNYYKERGDKMRVQQKRKMVEYSDQKTSLNIPKPRSKNNYCSACRQHYQDYLQVSMRLVSILKDRNINVKLIKIYSIDQYNQVHRKSHIQRTYKRTEQKTRPTRSLPNDSDDVQIISNPVKRIKPNQAIQPNQLQFNHNNSFRSQNFGDMRISSSRYNFKPFSSTCQDQINFNICPVNCQMNCPMNPITSMNSLNPINYMNPMSPRNSINYINSMNPMNSPINPMNCPMNSMNYMNPMNCPINSMNPMNYNPNMNMAMNSNSFVFRNPYATFSLMDVPYQPSLSYMRYPCMPSQPFFKQNSVSHPKPACIIIDE